MRWETEIMSEKAKGRYRGGKGWWEREVGRQRQGRWRDEEWARDAETHVRQRETELGSRPGCLDDLFAPRTMFGSVPCPVCLSCCHNKSRGSQSLCSTSRYTHYEAALPTRRTELSGLSSSRAPHSLLQPSPILDVCSRDPGSADVVLCSGLPLPSVSGLLSFRGAGEPAFSPLRMVFLTCQGPAGLCCWAHNDVEMDKQGPCCPEHHPVASPHVDLLEDFL